MIENSKNSAVDCGENTADGVSDEQLGKEITFILSSRSLLIFVVRCLMWLMLHNLGRADAWSVTKTLESVQIEGCLNYGVF